MAKLIYRDTEVQLASDDTVLDALLRHGVNVPHSCENGVCQSCMIRCESGSPTPTAQAGLKSTLVARNYFLACQCRLAKLGDSEELRVSLDEQNDLFIEATLVEKSIVAPGIVRLVFALEQPMDFLPGQFVHLRHTSGIVRSYSIASGPDDKRHLELHVGRVENGRMSSYLVDELPLGSTLAVRGPSGNCFYVRGRAEQPMLLVGTGTGLAPLLGIVRAALAEGHRGAVHLYHGSYRKDGLYLQDELEALASQHAQLHYHPCVDNATEAELRGTRLVLGRAADLALAAHPDLQGWRVFLCGHPGMVKVTKKLSFLAGASLADIYADPFEICETRRFNQTSPPIAKPTFLDPKDSNFRSA